MPPSHARHHAGLPPLLLAALTACTGGDTLPRSAEPVDPAAACRRVAPAPVALAVRDFITAAEPTPQRFLTAATTDSALPRTAEAVVERKGPLFLWLPDAAAQLAMRTKLEGDGPWVNMLVIVRGETVQPDGTVAVRVGGHYIGGEWHGRESPEVHFTIECQAGEPAAWRVIEAARSDGA
jgi:hypothetical protein